MHFGVTDVVDPPASSISTNGRHVATSCPLLELSDHRAVLPRAEGWSVASASRLRCVRRSRTRLRSLKELLFSQLVPDHLFDHLSMGVQGIPEGSSELYEELESAFYRVHGGSWRSRRTYMS